MPRKILSPEFFTRPTLQVAQDLLGKFLVRKFEKVASNKRGGEPLASRGVFRGVKEIAVMITEVEAYDGPQDRASHASRGLTERNAIMFGKGGYFYVYLCYGMYEMLNIVSGPQDYPAAILLRGGAIKTSPPREGCPSVSEGGEGWCKGLTRGNFIDGPGKLTKFLQVDRVFNKKPASKKTGLWFEDRGVKINDKTIKRTARIGVAYAGPVWSKKKYRFLLTKAEK